MFHYKFHAFSTLISYHSCPCVHRPDRPNETSSGLSNLSMSQFQLIWFSLKTQFLDLHFVHRPICTLVTEQATGGSRGSDRRETNDSVAMQNTRQKKCIPLSHPCHADQSRSWKQLVIGPTGQSRNTWLNWPCMLETHTGTKGFDHVDDNGNAQVRRYSCLDMNWAPHLEYMVERRYSSTYSYLSIREWRVI